MADTLKGKLIFKGEGKDRRRHLVFTTRKGKTWDNPVGLDRLAPDLRGSAEAEIAVELETDPQSGQPCRIRREGQAWVESAPITQKGTAQSAAGTGRGKNMPGKGGYNKQQSWKRDQDHPQSVSSNKKPDFHNPYNFIPAPPRDNDRVKKSGLGDCQPAGHDRYYPELYSGQLRVKMTVATPLLLPDTARVKVTGQGKAEHKSYPVRVDAESNPYIDPTAVKGMLRSAYEAITNSRLSVFKDHHERLAFRAPADAGITVVPARIEEDGDRMCVTLYTGNSQMERDGGPKLIDPNNHRKGREPLYAAWLRRYGSHREPKASLNGNHGQKVWAFITPWAHSGPGFDFWNVVELQPHSNNKPIQPPTENRVASSWRKANPASSPSGQWVEGFVCITNQNIKNKHDERVFFSTESNPPVRIALDDSEWESLAKKWQELIKNYRRTHEDEKGKLEEEPKNVPKWSRHIINSENETSLRNGALCYARVEPSGGSWRVIELYPVMISRRLHMISPLDLLDSSLRPPDKLSKLSPADRVFGWVNQDGKGAYRGQFRIGAVECKSSREEAIEEFSELGLPLAILGQPKPQQGRFYVAADEEGNAQPKGLNTEQAGYNDSAKGLRGRKVYPHHCLTLKSEDASYLERSKDYWNADKDHRLTPLDAGGFKIHQEYHRPPTKDGQERDNQNRSMHGWIRPDTVFELDVHFMNLSEVEFGALVWLLQLPDQAFHRFGGGKPLGFGSVRLELIGEASDVRSGAELMERYKSLDDGQPNKRKVTDFVAAFKKAVWSAYGSDFRETGDQETAEEYQKLMDGKFNEVKFIAAFLRAAQGFDKLPIHYPRTTRTPNPEGESFKWFVENASSTRDGVRHGYALGNLADDPGLPILEEG